MSSEQNPRSPTPAEITHPDLEWRETIQGKRPGDRFVRIAVHKGFTRNRGHRVPRPGADESGSALGKILGRVKRTLIGRPIPTVDELQERLSKIKGLSIFASDNISSSAYATEEIMRVLALAGAGALSLTLPITLVIIVVLAAVVTSYQQTIISYPNGGGSYVVASENLGPLPGLVAAGALLTDYVLTVAVSIAAGVAALTSIFPGMYDTRVMLGLGFVVLLCIGNLRGIRESGTLFAGPTYIYFGAIYGLLGYGFYLFFTGNLPVYVPPVDSPGHGHAVEALTLLLLLRAFSSGCVALTGVEAVSNGVPAFKPPESKNAQIVLILMSIFFATIFLGISFLANQLGVIPDPSEQETVISQLTRTLVGGGSPYHYLVQFSTAVLLVMAANTAYSGFPRLASFLARDRYLPRQFQFRGDRLDLSTGIVILSILAALLLVVFEGSVTNLIPLYTIGVFLAFTLSQSGMVQHWLRLRTPGWRWRSVVNGMGAVVTGIVMIVVGIAKFTLGAWMVMILIPTFVALMHGIKSHYTRLEHAREAETPIVPERVTVHVVVPVADVGIEARQAIAFARAIAKNDAFVVAIYVAEDEESAEAMRNAWEKWEPGVELVIIESPYRSLIGPLLAYIDALKETHPNNTITVVIPEFVPSRWWEHLLHNQTALRIKAALLFHPGIVVINVPYHLAPAESV